MNIDFFYVYSKFNVVPLNVFVRKISIFMNTVYLLIMLNLYRKIKFST